MIKAGNRELSGYFATLSASKYMLLTTFRRDGRAVATPVHVVAEVDGVYFRTWDVSGKAKRLRHTPTVEVAACSSRGRSRGAAVRARAVLLDGEASQQAARVLASKHPILHGRLIPWYHRRRGWITQQYRVDPPTGLPKVRVLRRHSGAVPSRTPGLRPATMTCYLAGRPC